MPDESRADTVIRLTAEQLKDIKHSFQSARTGHKLLADLFIELNERLSQTETEVWDQLFALSDFTEETHTAEFSYITSEVVFTQRKESVGKQGGAGRS